MRRGGSFGGGQSSLGHLSKSDVPATSPPGSTKATKPQKSPSNEGEKTKAEAPLSTPPAKPIFNNYLRAQGQNSGNFITGRPSTKVNSVPGGASSLGYLFGDK